MTHPSAPLMRNPREKSHIESKKFVAWFISELTWKAILIIALIQWKADIAQVSLGAWWFLLSIVVTAGFIGIGFILGQAALDKYVRVAEITAEQVSQKLGKLDISIKAPLNTKSDPPIDPKVSS